jgi:hypothetical protein
MGQHLHLAALPDPELAEAGLGSGKGHEGLGSAYMLYRTTRIVRLKWCCISKLFDSRPSPLAVKYVVDYKVCSSFILGRPRRWTTVRWWTQPRAYLFDDIATIR